MGQAERDKMNAVEALVSESAAVFFDQFGLHDEEKFDNLLKKLHTFQIVSPHAGGIEENVHDPEIELRTKFYELIDGMDFEQLAKAFNAAQDTFASVPEDAPLLWKDRDKIWKDQDNNKSKSCVDFVQEVYGPWIGKGLKRSHLQVLDGTLYRTLATYISRNGVPESLLSMETPGRTKAAGKEEITEKKLSELGISKPADALKVFEDNRIEAQRYYRAAQRILDV